MRWNVYNHQTLMYAVELGLIELTPMGYRITEFAKRFAHDRGLVWEG